jgi:hypothetical protein
MNKIIGSLTIIIAISAFALSCKKGENDPTISFKNRVDRIKGSWKLSSKVANITTTNSVGNVSTTNSVTAVYNGTDENITTNNTVITTQTRRYSIEIELAEDGSYKYIFRVLVLLPGQTSTYNTLVFTGTGNWNWDDSGFDKLGLSLVNDFDAPVPDSLNPQTFFPYQMNGSYYISKLTSSELILKQKGSGTDQIDTLINVTNYDATFTFSR